MSLKSITLKALYGAPPMKRRRSDELCFSNSSARARRTKREAVTLIEADGRGIFRFGLSTSLVFVRDEKGATAQKPVDV